MKLKTTFCAVGLVIATSSASFAATITETFESFSDGDLVANLAGLTVTAADGGGAEIATASFPVIPGEPLGLYNNAFSDAFTSALIFDFAGIGSSIGAFVDFGVIGDGIKIEVFDGLGGSGTLLATDFTVTETFLGVSVAGIKSAVFSQFGSSNATYLVDNLTYTFDDNAVSPVPLPAGGLLLLSGLFGVVGLKRLKKRAA